MSVQANRKFKREHSWVVTFDIWRMTPPIKIIKKVTKTMRGLSRLGVWADARLEAAKYNRTHKTKMDVFGVATKPSK
jgi:hypothetical protein